MGKYVVTGVKPGLIVAPWGEVDLSIASQDTLKRLADIGCPFVKLEPEPPKSVSGEKKPKAQAPDGEVSE